MSKQPKLGATGKFPNGKLNESDEGELEFDIANDGKLVHFNFGQPVSWFAVPPNVALEIAARLTTHAMDINIKLAKHRGLN